MNTNWKRIDKTLYESIRRVNRKKLKTIEHKCVDGYFLWIQGLDLETPWIKIEIIYSDVDDPVKYFRNETN
jgi:hypothetical protein